MDATAQGRAMELLGSFNDRTTRVFDDVFGTHWAEIEEILVISMVAWHGGVTTRELARVTQLNRRSVTRLIARLAAKEIVQTRRASADRRSIEVVLTREAESKAQAFRVAIEAFFLESADTARTIVEGLGGDKGSPRAVSTDAMELLCRVCEAGIALVRAMPAAASEGRLAARQRAALVLIASQGQARPRDLATALGVSRAGAAYIVDQLCAKAFVSRRRGAFPGDRRAVVIEVTADGARAVASVMAAIDAQSGTLAAVFRDVASRRRGLQQRKQVGGSAP